MRRTYVTGVAALATIVVVVAALAQTHAPSPARVPSKAAADKTPPPARPMLPRIPGEVPELSGPDDPEMERMDGPDAWDSMGMGPAGLYVPGPRRGGGAIRMRALIERRRELAKQLELSDEQRQRIEAIRDRQQRMGIEQRAKMNIARLDLRTLLRAERLDRQALEAKVDDISRIEAQLRKARLDMLLDMRNVLTPEQQKKLRALRGATGGEI